MRGRLADPRFALALAVLGIACLAAALYLPFLDNPLVFDDRALFSGRLHADIASSPFALEPRRPADFSIAFTQVTWGSIESHRAVSLALHAACGLALLWSLLALRVALLPAFLAAAFFSMHPAAVYAAAYLAQRATLLATLSSLLSLALFVHGLRRERHAFAVAAAAAFSLAVLSKEHSILVPGAVLLAIPLAAASRRFALKYGALYAACCAPAALLVLSMRAALLGTTYEPALDTLGPQLDAAASSYPAASAWLASALAQAGYFFGYLGTWLWPDVGHMAIDMPRDLSAAWAPGRALAAVAGFAAFGAAGIALLLRGGRLAPVGFGLLFTWLLFFVEFSSVRFQEPFVLYRSYLWAPGLAIAAAALLGRLPRAAALAAGVALIAFLLHAAHDRLSTFASPLALWQDAAAKLPAQPVPGAPRTLFNLGREQFYAGDAGQAVATADACIRKHPEGFYCWFGRGSLRLQQGSFEQALPDLERALELQPRSGMAQHHRGVALEGMGRLAEARAAYQAAYKLRFRPAAYRLRLLDEKALAPAAIRSAAPRPD